jgi:hypothetical protein
MRNDYLYSYPLILAETKPHKLRDIEFYKKAIRLKGEYSFKIPLQGI